MKLSRRKWNTEEQQSLDVIDEGISRTSEILKLLNTFQQNKDAKYQRCDLNLILADCLEEIKVDIPSHIKRSIIKDDKAAIVDGNLNDLMRLFMEL